MLISIIIPVYNVEKYIIECLQSVVKQTYNGPLECIIVNDCTPDSSMTLVNDFISEYSGDVIFSIINKKNNGGLSSARNAGIKAAKGEYIYLLDSDDIITLDCIELLAKPLMQKKYDMVIGNIITFGDYRGTPKLCLNDGEYVQENILKLYMQGMFYPMAVNKLCSRNLLLEQEISFKEGILHEDELWSFTLANKLRSMYVVCQETYKYRIHGESIMANKNSNKKTLESLSAIYFEMMMMVDEKCFENKLYNDFFEYVRKHFMPFLFDDSYLIDNEREVFNRYISVNKINPVKNYLNKIIPFKYLLRDFYLVLPQCMAYYYWRIYMYLRGRR